MRLLITLWLLLAPVFAFAQPVTLGVPQPGPVGFVGPVSGAASTSYVLDQLASYPVVDYSVRQDTGGQYLPAYDMTVRRSSDNATANIGFVAGLLDTTTLSSFCAATNCYVVTWKNQGSLGSAGDATQSTAASQPQIVASGVVETQNRVPTVYFGGSQTLQTAGNVGVTGTQPSFMSGVLAWPSPSAYHQATGFGTPYTGQFRTIGSSPGSLFVASTYNGDASGGSITANTAYIVAGSFYYPVVTVLANGNVVSSNGNVAFNTTATPLVIGASNAGTSDNIGNESEIVHWFITLPTSDKSTYDLNTASFFGIAGVTQ